jgi:hypothetical protein
MRRALLDAIAPAVYGAVDFLVILAPALVVKVAADRGGMGDTHGLDLVVASAALGTVHAVVAGARLRGEARSALRRGDMWVAAVDALVVLGLAATVLPVVVLWGLADEHASVANHGYPVVALWAGVQAAAIVAAETTGRVVFWWLEPHPRSRFRIGGHLVGLRSPWRHVEPSGDHRR